jgi:hypothetical protein
VSIQATVGSFVVLYYCETAPVQTCHPEKGKHTPFPWQAWDLDPAWMRRPIDDPVLPTPRRLCQQEPASEVLESTRIEAGGRNPDVTYTGRPAAPLLDRVPSIHPSGQPRQACKSVVTRHDTRSIDPCIYRIRSNLCFSFKFLREYVYANAVVTSRWFWLVGA